MIVFLLSDNTLRFITDHQHGQTTVQDLWEQGNANIDAGFRRCRKNKYPFVERSIDVYVVWIAQLVLLCWEHFGETTKCESRINIATLVSLGLVSQK